MAGTHRAHIIIPRDMLKEIDSLVGPRGRSSFLLETARQEIQRRKLLRFLQGEEPTWKTENHPELSDGAAGWVRQIRKQSESRGVEGKRSRTRKRKP